MYQSEATPYPTPERWGLLAIVTACVLWGGTFYLGKVALREVPTDQVVLWRFTLAVMCLAPLVGVQALRRRRMIVPEAPRPGRRLRQDAPLVVLSALLMVPVQFVLQFEGLARTTASSASLIIGAFAPLMALAAAVFARERLGRLGWGAVACSTLGLALMVGAPGEGRTLVGDLMVLGSLVATVAWVLTTQRLVRRHDALVVTVVGMGLGVLLLVPWSWLVSGPPRLTFSPEVWGALVGLGIGCTALTFSLWNWGLRYIPASRAGVYVNLEPLVGTVLGVVLLQEAVTPGLLAGGLLILASALIISWPASAATPASASA